MRGLAGLVVLALIAWLIGGVRRAEVAALGWRALVTGTLATLTSGAVVGLLTP